MVIVAPFLQNMLNIPTGLCAFTASLVLGVMATPTVASLAEDALSFVPRSFREASLALGANRWQTLTKVVVPAAGSGISTAIILGMGRAVGETMTVLMVAGGAAVIPKSIFDPVRPMTSTIAAEMGEAVMGSLHFHALFAIGLVLFLITLGINIIAEIISRRYRLKLGLGR
jgi:phosphate transport system permease protein